MSFTTPCYIQKNTPELRKKLEELGYNFLDKEMIDKYGLKTYINPGGFGSYYQTFIEYGAIDCGTNEPLFLAIAALRDDTDYMQWFTDGSDFILCDREDWIDMYSVLCSGKGSSYQNELDKYHKATVEELIEHFKTKEQ